MQTMLGLPHGGRLVDRTVKDEEEREYFFKKTPGLKQVVLNRDQIEDLQNIADGSYSPLRGFLNRHDFLKVVRDMALEDGTVWPVPIVLAVSPDQAERVRDAREIALVDRQGAVLAVMELEQVYDYDKEATAKELYGTSDCKHPGVQEWLAQGDLLLGGTIRLLQRGLTQFDQYRLKPIETRVLFKAKGWRTIVGFQTRNVPHRGHEYVQKSALEIVDGILIHPKIGKKKRGDFKDELILKAYQVLMDHYYLRNRAALSLFAAKLRSMGPR
ncbi:MAG: sulfate adenylyltransferase, partial [Candidatus Bipolaricaulia bacterium]